ncbi:hypothetical protein WOC76_05270 [Methylocystis sp. IM3]|uniref:head-tail connector protein n=1 Tax=unclassified Methylocystis TaxID=2625913 RepID=UPI000FB64CBD|nr:MAG: hypothetical protein EKK29_03450 [Hyphomicrobiales bacterium]
MRPVLIGAPATEPVSLTEMKAWLREDGSEEDQLIQALVVSARMTLEAYTRRFFVTQSWRVMLDTWPRGSLLRLPFSPFQAVSAIRVYDPGGFAQTLSPDSYLAPPASDGGCLVFTSAPPPPCRIADGIEIDFSVGYGASPNETPEPLRRAIMVLATHWRENRGDDGDDALPKSVLQLASPFRRTRLA